MYRSSQLGLGSQAKVITSVGSFDALPLSGAEGTPLSLGNWRVRVGSGQDSHCLRSEQIEAHASWQSHCGGQLCVWQLKRFNGLCQLRMVCQDLMASFPDQNQWIKKLFPKKSMSLQDVLCQTVCA
jgi:hypothetical protein